jgi:TP901 family phage tail tape measure protein
MAIVASELKVLVKADVADVERGLTSADRSVTQFAAGAERSSATASRGFSTMGTAAGLAGGVIAAGLAGAVGAAANFEQGMSRVKAATNATGAEMGQLSALALQLGQSTDLAGIDATDAATAMASLAKAGVSVADQMGGATKGALLLASAGEVSVGEAADVAARAMNVFGLAGSDVAMVADTLSAAANKSATDVGKLDQAFGQSAQVAAQSGLSFEQLTGTLALLAQHGLEGSDAGTSLKTALIALHAPTDQAQALMDQLGIHVFDAAGKSRDFADVADDLQHALSGMSDAQRDATLKTLLGNDAVRVGSIIYKEGGAGIRDWTAKVQDAGNAARTGQTLNDNLKGSVDQLKASLQTAGITIGQELVPDLDALAKKVTSAVDWFEHLDPAVRKNIVHAAEATAGFLLLAGATSKVIDSTRTLTGAIGDVIGAFARKEAAKKSLTAANEGLATSMGATRLATLAVAGAIGDAAIVTAAAVAPIALGAAGWRAWNDASGGTAQLMSELETRQAAVNIVMAAGGTETDALVVGFGHYLDAANITVATQDQLVAAWDRYLLGLRAANVETGGAIIATTAFGNAATALGASLTAGVVPAVTGLATGAQAAVPAMGQLTTGALAAVPAMGQLTTGAQAAAAAMAPATGAASGMAVAMYTSRDAANDAAAAINAYTGVLGQLGSEQSALQGNLAILQGEWDRTTAAIKAQGYATAEQQATLERLAPAIQFDNAQLGVNRDAQVQAALAANQATQSYQNASLAADTHTASLQRHRTAALDSQNAMQTASAAGAGFTAGLGALKWATDAAAAATSTGTTRAQEYREALLNVPPAVKTDVTAPGLVESTTDVLNLTDAINDVPRSFTVTATVDTSAAEAAIGRLRAMMPSSPAEEGPFRTLPDWESVFAAFPDAAVRHGILGMAELHDLIRQSDRGLSTALVDAASSALTAAAGDGYVISAGHELGAAMSAAIADGATHGAEAACASVHSAHAALAGCAGAGLADSKDALADEAHGFGEAIGSSLADGLHSQLQAVLDEASALAAAAQVRGQFDPNAGIGHSHFPGIPALAGGGVVTRPTVALLAERQPEAVIPLSRAGGYTPSGGEIHLHFEGATFYGFNDFDRQVRKALVAAHRDGFFSPATGW